MLKITRAADPITVERLNMVIYGPPGIAKTSLAFTADAPLLLDFDKGSHRAANRKDVVRVTAWGDVASMTAEDLAPFKTVIVDTAGRALDALQVGVASWRLGAGRERKEDAVQFGAGIELHAQVGSQVVAGAPLMTLFTDDEPRFARALDSLENSFSIGSGSVERKIVIDRIS